MVRALITGKNAELARGIRTRGARVNKRRVSAFIKKNGPGKKVEKAAKPTTVTKKFGKSGERTVRLNKAPRFYPVERTRKTQKRNKKSRTETLRASLTPGTVCILLTGKYRGKRVVFLKQLESGLLLVNGPFKLNGVPLRRVAQSYVIATSTKVELGDYTVDAALNDDFFKPKKASVKRSNEDIYLKRGKAPKTPLSDERKALQKAADDVILAAVKKVEHLGSYLSSRFTLTNGQRAHDLVF
eukprot:TRINITY_DN924_c0_g2_i1.p1 TRINITY_DN924_c0_g2~~TRINITY_DN924_c0_g2_i1.p1  ORF type:complete len:242 (+),score=135.62 TRINITY_DN924_c0_g2_i1:110-835(+)